MKLKNYLSTLIMAIATIHLSDVSAQQTATPKRSGPSINAGNSNGIKLGTATDTNTQTLAENSMLENQEETVVDTTATSQHNVDTPNNTAMTEPSTQVATESGISEQQALPPIPMETSNNSTTSNDDITEPVNSSLTNQQAEQNQEEMTKATTLSTDDQDNTPADQDKILETLKILENHDTTTRQLLTNDWTNQLFNNFVYFKNFIVTNFQKNKILQLFTEFIDQIYPKEYVTTLKSSQPQPEINNNNEQTTDNAQNQFMMQSLPQDNNQFSENNFAQQSADVTNSQDINNQAFMQQAPIAQAQEQFTDLDQQEAQVEGEIPQEISPEFHQEMNNLGESEEHQEFDEQAIENQQF